MTPAFCDIASSSYHAIRVLSDTADTTDDEQEKNSNSRVLLRGQLHLWCRYWRTSNKNALQTHIHSVSDCFQDRFMGKLDSVKPSDMLQGTTNLIKSQKSRMLIFIQFQSLPEKSKKWPTSAPQMTRRKEPLEIRTCCIRTSADDSAIVLPMTKVRFHEVPNQIQFRTLQKRWKTKNAEQPNYDSRIHQNCGVSLLFQFLRPT